MLCLRCDAVLDYKATLDGNPASDRNTFVNPVATIFNYTALSPCALLLLKRHAPAGT